MSERGIVVDVGGTTTLLAMHRNGALAGPIRRFATPSPRNRQAGVDSLRAELFDRIASAAVDLRGENGDSVDDVGIAFGAAVTHRGEVLDASVLWLTPSVGFDVVAAVRSRLPWARVLVLNDVAAAAWHYRHLTRFALVTVSTGVAFKVFDGRLPVGQRVLADEDGLGGESGHTLVEPNLPGDLPAGLGAAAAAGDRQARAELERRELPWCECGAVADLCSYASGPGAVRLTTAMARRQPAAFAASALSDLVSGVPERIGTAALAEAAGVRDPFTLAALGHSTRPLATRLLQLSADLGLHRTVVVGGFAHAVGTPWFTALGSNVEEQAIAAGWFRNWAPGDWTKLVHQPPDAGLSSLAGMAAYLHQYREQVRTIVKPVGEAKVVHRLRPRAACGAGHFLLRPLFAGVCGTDLQILRGDRTGEPGIPGHECVGEVVETGMGVSGVDEGDHVVLNPNNPLDDEDKLGHNRPGVLADVLRFDAGLLHRGQVIGLDGKASPESVLLEPLAAVVRAQDLTASLRPPRRVLVVGAGTAGLLHVMLARRRGAQSVHLLTRSAASRRRAVTLGVCAPGQAVTPGPGLAAEVLAVTGGEGIDTAIIAVGGRAGPEMTALIRPLLADGAVVHLFGGFTGVSTLTIGRQAVPLGDLRSRAGHLAVTGSAGRPAVLTGSRGGLRTHFTAARELLAAWPGEETRPGTLISHVISLAAVPEVLAELAGAGTVCGEPALKVVVDFSLDDVVVRGCPAEGSR
ncbi:ROK family protein [Amycolatopsis tolypomycina]|uniref:ROK family protein n=1 Tax=Amycolatopsis tolypomycina TaxID=208445 RepID=UPI0033AA9E90